MLAYIGQFRDDEWCSLIHGETRGKAKLRFLECTCGMGNDEFTEIRLRRLPGLDNKPITYQNAKDAGFEYSSMEFDENGDEIYNDPEHFINDCDCPVCREGKNVD